MTAQDDDCQCNLPRPLTDAELEAHAATRQLPSHRTMPSHSTMAGFIAFSELCKISGRIQRLHSPLQIRRLAVREKHERFYRSVHKLQRSLDDWQDKLPRELLYSAKEKQT